MTQAPRTVAIGEWDAEVAGFSAPSILQGAVWGALKSRWGWSVHRLKWDVPESAAQVLLRRLPVGGRFAYLPHGPLLPADAGADAWGMALSRLREWMSTAGVAVAKVELDVDAGRGDIGAVLPSLGWRRSHEAVQFPHTMRSSLGGGDDALGDRLKQKTRYNVALAVRRGVVVRSVGEEAIDAFYNLYAETAERDGFALRTRAYYVDAWRSFLRAGQATILLAEKDGRALAGVIPVAYGETAFYLYGASATEGRRDMPSYLAQWESLRWAAGRGCRVYDWWGGPTTQAADDPLWGVQRFKSGFGASLVERLGPWDLALSPARYLAYRRLTALRRRALGWRRVAATTAPAVALERLFA